MSIIRPRKLQGRKIYKKAQILVCTFLVYSFTALICCLFCSYPLWFPSMKHFLYVSLTNAYSLFINPKCLFIVGNMIIIVIFLCESKVSSGSNLSPCTTEVFEGHAESNPTHRFSSTEDNKVEEEGGLEKQMILVVEREYRSDDQDCNECQVKKENNVTEQEVANDQEEDEEEADEELTRKVENFIAKVNKQRWLEANSLVRCRGA